MFKNQFYKILQWIVLDTYTSYNIIQTTWQTWLKAGMDPGVENWRGDNWCKRSGSGRGPGAQPPEIFWSLLSVQTTQRSNLAQAGRR